MPQQPSNLSGRISDAPARLLHEEILAPQFRFEATHLLPWYVAIEKALAAEYVRMELISTAEAVRIGHLLDAAAAGLGDADPVANMSDIAFALERFVDGGLSTPVPAWHVDRSRNDLQSTAQLMFLRERVRAVAAALLDLVDVVQRAAAGRTTTPMPGYTHFQAAQVTTPAFHLTALSGQLLHTARRLLATYDGLDRCPLGAGAMAGQRLPWDRDRMAALLGFDRAAPHALTGVASRRGPAEVTAELSLLGVELSRFVTDLITWGGSDCGYIDLPDELSGISSAMPQKKNFPVLERIRGRTAHLSAFHVDVLLGQRNTPYTNLVEVSKEAGAHVHRATDTALVVLRLLAVVVEALRFDERRMRAACEREFLGGFALANLLTLRESIPWRRAQVIAGRYVVAAHDAGLAPGRPDPALLVDAARAEGFEVGDAGGHLSEAFDVDAGLASLCTAGSAHPDQVRALLDGQRAELADLHTQWTMRSAASGAALVELDRVLGLAPRPESGRTG